MPLAEDLYSAMRKYKKFNASMMPWTPQNEDPPGTKVLKKILGPKAYIVDMYGDVQREPNYLNKLRILFRMGEEFWK